MVESYHLFFRAAILNLKYYSFMFSEVINGFAKFLWIADSDDLRVTSDVALLSN